MKKLAFAALAVSALMFTSCGGEEKKEDKKKDNKEASKEEVKEEVKEETIEVSLVEMDLSDHGYPITIEVPDDVTFEKGSYVDVLKNADGSFALTLSAMEWSKEEALGEAKKNDVNKFKEMLDETDNGYLIQTEVMGKDDFHMWMSVDGGLEEPIIFENEKGNMPTKATATVMFNSLKSAKKK